MTKKDNILGLLTEDEKRYAIQKIIDYFGDERDEEIGVIAGEDILEAITGIVGNMYYNKGISDAVSLYIERTDNLQADIEALTRLGDS